MNSLGALAVIALGAVLAFAVSDRIEGVQLQTIGYIIMAAGAVGFVLSLFVDFRSRKLSSEREVVQTPGGYKERVENK